MPRPASRRPRATSGVGFSLAELAVLVGGRVEGDAARVVEALRSLDSAAPGDLSFLSHPRYRDRARESRAGALVVAEGMADRAALGRDLLVVADPALAVARLL